jgi:hypothetical protein
MTSFSVSRRIKEKEMRNHGRGFSSLLEAELKIKD